MTRYTDPMFRVTLEPWTDDEPTISFFDTIDQAYTWIAGHTLVGWQAVRIDPITPPEEN